MRALHGGPDFPNPLHGGAGDREFAPPDPEVDDASFEAGLRVVVTTVTALIAISILSAICSVAFTI